ncbi:MAG: GMP synthase (glutamine-hydrolyzing) [Gammaproteobacteria bacterium HGW-Gammaproteobacteria-8]|nr:MAG: GMP synthase (glutamine-hydrolyzing) [Gammaproteobacteria bacterium HGW-Gammaproteobacteria-8]
MSESRTTDIHASRILILDFGSQYTQLIARRVREIGVYSEILPFDAEPELIREFRPRGIILSGGPESVAFDDSPRIPAIVFELGVPLLGICYGMQAMAGHFGGKVDPSDEKEFGYAEVAIANRSRLLAGIEDRVAVNGRGVLEVWMSHGDKVTALPEGFELMCTTGSAPIAGMADDARGYYGLQFHPEVTHTRQGRRILERFVRDIAGCDADWTTEAIIADQIARVRESVGSDRVLLGLSGGVDSSVVAALLHEAIGDQLLCIFVDTGLLRFQEGDQVMATFAEHLGVRVERVDARDPFMNALAGVSDPEAKRKIIGREFIRVFEAAAGRHQEAAWLAQGTIYPDVIESAGAATGKAKVIKSHHNVGGLPEDMQLKLIEPLRELFKDEVRRIGVELGLPAELVMRHPFPGPGLGVRILGEVRPEYVEPLQKADHIFISELRKAGLYDKVSQAFAVFLPVKSVGVVGDARRYEYVIALRAVETVDFMTARWAYLDHEFLDQVSRRIINECDGISRVVYDISGKPPATIEWE